MFICFMLYRDILLQKYTPYHMKISILYSFRVVGSILFGLFDLKTNELKSQQTGYDKLRK